MKKEPGKTSELEDTRNIHIQKFQMKTRLNKKGGEGQDSRSMCFDLAKIFSIEKKL